MLIKYMQNKKNLIIIVVIALVLIVGYIAFGPQANGEVVKIGVILPLTGDAAAYGEPGRNVVQMAADEINAQGGIDGRPIALIIEDGKCNGTDAASAMQKLVNVDRVKVVIGGFCSGESLAAAPIANANKVLLFSPSASSPDLTNAGDYFFRNYPSDAAQGSVMAEVAYDKGWETVAVIYEQTDYASGVFKAFEARYTSLGGQIILIESFVPDTKDFRTSVAKLKATGADALLISTQVPAAAEIILKQIQEQGWSPQLIVNDVFAGGDIPANNPTLVEGALTAEFGYDAASPSFQKFVSDYTSRFGTAPEWLSYAQTEYDAVYMLADAMTEVGEDADKLVDWLYNSKGWTGISGVVEFDANGDRTSAHRAEIITNGKPEPITE